MDLSRNIQMDLLYLTNDRMRMRVGNLDNGVNKEELKFYRKRILQQTKNYLRESRLENSIDRAFDNYADKLIEYYKFIDKKEMIQKEYEDMKDAMNRKYGQPGVLLPNLIEDLRKLPDDPKNHDLESKNISLILNFMLWLETHDRKHESRMVLRLPNSLPCFNGNLDSLALILVFANFANRIWNFP